MSIAQVVDPLKWFADNDNTFIFGRTTLAIINRVARLFKADLHAVLDHIEEPQLQLQQAIREMQEELDDTESQLKRAQYEVNELEERKKTSQNNIKRIDEEVSLCLSNKNDDLARTLLRKRLQEDRLQETLQKQFTHTSQAITAFEKQYKEQASLLSSMQQKSELFENVTSVVRPSHVCSHFDDGAAVTDSDVEVALLKEKERLSSSKLTR